METASKLDGAEFSRHILANHQKMKMLVLAIAPGCTEADDIVQEACTAMWKKFHEFDSQRPFAAWALTFVRFQTLAWLKRKQRDRLKLSDHTIEKLCASISESPRFGNERAEALELCIAGLPESEQQLLTLHFVEGVSIADISKSDSYSKQRSTASLYKMFSKIKASLLRCVQSKMEAGR